MIEHRSQPRLIDSDLVMVCWGEGPSRLNQLANVRDVSLGGIGLLVGHVLPVGTPVTVTYGDGELKGIVRHNSQLVDGNCVGIEFVGDSRNSVLHFQPELLVR